MSTRASEDDPLFQNHVAVTFRWPYDADEVYVTGDWNDFKLTPDHRLVANKDSTVTVFKLTLMLLPGIHRYKFYVNNSWEIDPKKPVTLGGMSNLVVVGHVQSLDLSRKIAGDVQSEEWDLIGWKLNEAWFMSSVLQVIGNCRSKLKTLKTSTDLKSINGKLLSAVLQSQATAEDFCRQLTIAPELYFNCDAGDFVNLLFETMIKEGDKDNLNEFLFINVHKQFSPCSKCQYEGEMLAQTSVFMLNVIPTPEEMASGKKFEAMVLDNIQPKEPCPACGNADCEVVVSFDTLPRFLLVNTSAYFAVNQISSTIVIPNAKLSERHHYDLIGCNTATANTYHTAIARSSPGKWTLYADTDRTDLPSWDQAAKRIAWGKATFFVYERADIRRERPLLRSSASNSPSASRSELPEFTN